jgi:hypothetical protein
MGDARAPHEAAVALQREENGDLGAVGELVAAVARLEARFEAGAKIVQGVGGRPSCATPGAAATAKSATTAAAAPDLRGVTVSPEDRLAAREAFRRPKRLRIVIGLEGGDACGQLDPRQLGAGVDMGVGRKRRRLVERADPHE